MALSQLRLLVLIALEVVAAGLVVVVVGVVVVLVEVVVVTVVVVVAGCAWDVVVTVGKVVDVVVGLVEVVVVVTGKIVVVEFETFRHGPVTWLVMLFTYAEFNIGFPVRSNTLTRHKSRKNTVSLRLRLF